MKFTLSRLSVVPWIHSPKILPLLRVYSSVSSHYLRFSLLGFFSLLKVYFSQSSYYLRFTPLGSFHYLRFTLLRFFSLLRVYFFESSYYLRFTPLGFFLSSIWSLLTYLVFSLIRYLIVLNLFGPCLTFDFLNPPDFPLQYIRLFLTCLNFPLLSI